MHDKGFIKFMRSDKAGALLGDPRAFVLATVIALRARRTDDVNLYDLTIGEALLGDYERYGMTRQQYRCAMGRLARWGIATFRATNKGTIARLCDDTIYDIHQEPCNPRRNERATDE